MSEQQKAGASAWEGNSERMFERMIQEVPESLQEVFRGKLMGIVTETAGGGPITEDIILAIVKGTVPEPFKGNILKAYATMGGVDLSVIDEILKQNPGGEERMLAVLHAVQGQFGYVPEEALYAISQKTGVALSRLYRLVTSYQAFGMKKPKPHVIAVCSCTGCYVKGAGALYDELQAKVAKNRTDVTLTKVRNLGCCNMSPTVMVDGEIYSGLLDKSKIEKFVH